MPDGSVVIYFSQFGAPLYAHELKSIEAVGAAIAEIKECPFAGVFDRERRCIDGTFFVPDDTLMVDEAETLGIRGPEKFFGGIAPHPFVKTKAISHGLVDDRAERPEGWVSAFAERVEDVVLPGYTAFSICDVRVAASRLLCQGRMRVKKARASGGRGQRTVTNSHELNAFLETVPADDLARCGVVLETRGSQDARRGACYAGRDRRVGSQRLGERQCGAVYGGSKLTCVQGGWGVLEELAMPDHVRIGVAQARHYDREMAAYPRVIGSRRNYDVGQGCDPSGEWRSGVFEASWRVGGASAAELGGGHGRRGGIRHCGSLRLLSSRSSERSRRSPPVLSLISAVKIPKMGRSSDMSA
jgi:hypothetical protein